MSGTSSSLPDLHQLDSDALRTLILSQHEQILLKDEQLASRDAEIEQLKLLIAKLRRMQFGRKSEKVERQIEQLQLRLDELEASRAERASSAATPETHRATKPVRRPLPEHLPRETRQILPKQTVCPDCGGELKRLGEDVSEMLEWVPASFKVIRQVRPKVACGRCDKIVQAEAPSRPIARGLAGPGLLAHVLVSKYCDHLPLYRQEEIYEREGVELDRATLADWVGGASGLLQPLVEALRHHVLSATKLHVDDTPVPVLAPGLGKTKLGRLWAYVRDDRPAGDATPPAVWFAYAAALFFPVLARARAPACHRHAASSRSARDAAALPPAAEVIRSRRPPNRPASRGPVPRLRARRSLPAGTAEVDRSTLTPARGPAVPDRQASRDWTARCFGLHDLVTAPAGHLRPHLPDNFKLAGTHSSISDTSSPRRFNSPPQSGHTVCFGRICLVSRGKCSAAAAALVLSHDVFQA